MTRSALCFLALCITAPLFGQAGYVPRPFVVSHYDLALNVTPADSTIRGVCTIMAQSVDDTLQNARFDMRGLTIDSVKVDDRIAIFSTDSAGLYVHLYLVMPRNVNFAVKVWYHGSPRTPKGETWGGFTWGEPTYSIGVGFVSQDVSLTRYWMPCLDLPDSKSSVDFHITVPRPLVAAATGKLVRIDTGANYLTYHWSENNPCATYLMCFAVGHYTRIQFTADSLPVEIYALPPDTAASRTFFAFLDGTLKTFIARFGAYPFDKVGYALLGVSGGMEHQSLVGFGPQFVHNNSYRYLAAHELAHQWWGDCVSPFEFNEAWLSEGFATYSEAIDKEGLTNRAAYENTIHGFMNSYMGTDATNEGVFPLYNYPRAAPSSNYPRTIYDKGASVLGMLRWMYGDSLFFKALAFYRQQHDYQSAKTSDLQHAFEVVTADTLGWFFNEWVYSAGWPVVWTAVHQSDSVRITLKQIQNRTVAPLFRMPYEVMLMYKAGDTVRTTLMMEARDSQVITLPVPGRAVKSYRFDPSYHVLGKHVDTVLVGVREPVEPFSPGLQQNFPNPVTGGAQTTITIARSIVEGESSVRLRLFDSAGHVVRDCPLRTAELGERYTIDVTGLPTGSYLYAIDSAKGHMENVLTIAR